MNTGYATKKLLGLRTGGTAPPLADPPAVTPMPVGLKSCRRCHGDTHMVLDRWGAYVCCLTCGFHTDIDREPRRIVRGPGKPGRPRA